MQKKTVKTPQVPRFCHPANDVVSADRLWFHHHRGASATQWLRSATVLSKPHHSTSLWHRLIDCALFRNNRGHHIALPWQQLHFVYFPILGVALPATSRYEQLSAIESLCRPGSIVSDQH